MELLQTIEKHCSWFPSLLTLDLGTWEKVDNELEKLLYKGVPLPVSSWSIWTLIKSILEPLQTPESSEGREDDGENPSKGESEKSHLNICHDTQWATVFLVILEGNVIPFPVH